MSKISKPWLRGAVTLAVLVGLGAALVASPAGAHFLHPSKGQVKKVAKKEATKVFNQKIGPAIAGKQDKCANGAVIAYAMVDIDAVGATFSSSPATPQFNCAGGPVEVRDDPDFGDGLTNIRIPGVTTGAGGSANLAANVTSNMGVLFPNPIPIVAMGDVAEDAGFDHMTVALYDSDGVFYDAGVPGQDFTITIFNT